MPSKTVVAQVSQGTGFRTECRAGKHTVVIDQPSGPGGGTDAGPSPLEYQLFALGGCIAAIGRIMAMQRRVALHGITVAVEGDINTDGLLGKKGDARVGFSAIRARVSVDADLPAEEKEKLVHEIDGRCPISENLQHETPVTVTLAG